MEIEGLNIQFDYRFDSAGFFALPERRAVLETAANIWSSYIAEDFTNIPAGTTLSVPIGYLSEVTSSSYTLTTSYQSVSLNEPTDDVLIFIYTFDLPPAFSTLAQGGPAGSYSWGSEEERRFLGSDFEPWMGAIRFNTTSNFFFDTTPQNADVPSNRNDFLSVALHEIGHVLGFGTSTAFSHLVNQQQFLGTRSVALNSNQSIPLNEDVGHIQENFTLDPASEALMDPFESIGTRTLPTALDLAMLSDIGYKIVLFDPAQYLASYEDLITVFGYNLEAARQHHDSDGMFEGRLNDRFDELGYLASSPDLLNIFGADLQAATRHYIENGYLENRRLDLFDAIRYIASHGDLLTAFGKDITAAKQHYIQSGYKEGRQITFNSNLYMASNPDLIVPLAKDRSLAVHHYIDFGYSEKRPIDLFNPQQYIASYLDLATALGTNFDAAVAHFVDYGYGERRSPDVFDEYRYIASHEDLIEAFQLNGQAATEHYISHGIRENRPPTLFDPFSYMNLNPDVASAVSGNSLLATQHYILYGFEERRAIA